MKKYWYSLEQKMIELRNFCFHFGASIYMFHQINDNKDLWEDDAVSISRKGFEEFIEGLLINGAVFRSIDELDKHCETNSVYLTFDDVYQDMIDNAIPFLLNRGIPFCLFVSQKFIDKEGFISTETLKNLAAEKLCTIGFHSKNHELMRLLDEEQMGSELDCSDFDHVVGEHSKYFAFPYGSIYACNHTCRKLIKKRGYEFVFSTLYGTCTPRVISSKPHFVPRININEENYLKRINTFCRNRGINK